MKSDKEPAIGKIIGISVGAAAGLIIAIILISKVTGGRSRTDTATDTATAVVTTAEATTEASDSADVSSVDASAEASSDTDTSSSSDVTSSALPGSGSEEDSSSAGESPGDVSGDDTGSGSLPGGGLPTSADSDSSDASGSASEATSVYTDPSGVPTSAEFTWFDNIAGGSTKPDDYFTSASVLSGSTQLGGTWKAYLRSIPGEKSSEGRHYLNVELESTGRSVVATLKWGTYEDLNGGSLQDESSLDSTKFTGTWDASEETITATSSVGQLYIGGFAKSGETSYGFGVLQATDGTKDYLILMR